ncbi:dolichyldiphosphatase [Angomonas deanei]|nr:dolichyldiphosphatase [Angomonas deanei]|eukprot:EPY34840.1 dolichyldiphosphatase [Angomonas deanei]
MDFIRRFLAYAHLESLCGMSSNQLALCQPEGWASWAMTEVVYAEESYRSFLLGIFSFLPIVIVLFLAGFASALPVTVPRPDTTQFLVLNTVLNRVFKKMVDQPRPPHPAEINSVGKGFPSDHAQFMSFFVVYLIVRGGTTKKRVSRPYVLFYAVMTAIVCYSRVYNGHHTVGQVLAGVGVGAVLGWGCATAVLQRPMRWLVDKCITTIMLWCTGWTAHIV